LPPKKLHHYIKKSKGRLLKRIMKGSVFGKSKLFAFPRNHRFFESFNKVMKQMITAGILDHFGDENRDLVKDKTFASFTHSTVDAMQPMSLEHLKAGFAIWLTALCLPVTAFIIEWALVFIDYVIFKCLYFAFIKKLQQDVKNRNKLLLAELKKMKLAKYYETKKKRNEAQSYQRPQVSNLDEIVVMNL
jgi:hypothetical protein